MTRADTIEAINYISQSRYTHEEWITWLIKARACNCDECKEWLKKAIPIAGDVEHHREFVRKYDHVLKVLKRI